MRTLTRGAWLVALAATVLGGSRATAQDTTTAARRVGRILGIFDEAGDPLEGVDVVDRIGGGSMRTTRSGLVGMGVLSNQHDSAVVTIRKIGFADTTVLVMVGARDTVPMQVFLRRAVAIEGVSINAKETEHLPVYLRDFEERLRDSRYTGAKTFTPAELRKNDGLRLFDVLFTKRVGIGSKPCLLVLRDDVPWVPPEVESGSAGVPKEGVDQFDAAVFYTIAQMPSELPHTGVVTNFSKDGFHVAPPCGALLLYSRHKI